MLHVIYRACAASTGQKRPPYFTKLSCLHNFLVAFRTLQATEDATLLVINDGALGDDFRLIIEPLGSIEILPNVGNSASCWHALQKATQLPPTDLVYFVEDDYLHTPDALSQLVACYRDCHPDYITLYDHPDRYSGRDVPVPDPTVCLSKSAYHWRQVESTTMTFAAAAGTVTKDMFLFEIYVHQTRSPADRLLFHHLQGVGYYRTTSWRKHLASLIPTQVYASVSDPQKYGDVHQPLAARKLSQQDLLGRLHRLERYRYPSPHRKLLGPIPSLATHCENDWLAPGIDWEQLATSSTHLEPQIIR